MSNTKGQFITTFTLFLQYSFITSLWLYKFLLVEEPHPPSFKYYCTIQSAQIGTGIFRP